MSDSRHREFITFLSSEDVIEKANESLEGKSWIPLIETSNAALISLKTPMVATLFKRLFDTKYAFIYRSIEGQLVSASSESTVALVETLILAATERPVFDESFMSFLDFFKEAPQILERIVVHYANRIVNQSDSFVTGLRDLKILYEKVRRRAEQFGVNLPLSEFVSSVFGLDTTLLPLIESDLVDFLAKFPPTEEGVFRFLDNQIKLAVGEYDESSVEIQLSRLETIIREIKRYCSTFMKWLTVPDNLFIAFLERGIRKHGTLATWLEGIKEARTEYGLCQSHWEEARKWYFEKISARILPSFQKSMAGWACWTIVEERQIKEPLAHAGETMRYSARRSEFRIIKAEESGGVYVLCSIDELIVSSLGLMKAGRNFPFNSIRTQLEELKLSREAFLDSKDALFVGYTWKYLLPGGGPDKEAKNNERIECFNYYVVTVSATGFGVPLIKLFFAKEESARTFIEFLREARVMSTWKEYPQNGLPASLKAKQKNRSEYQCESNAEDKDQKTVEDLIIERLIEEDAEEESEGPEVPETKNKPISIDLLEKINSLHYELEWTVKRMNEIEWNYCFPELDTAELGRVNLPEMPEERDGFKELEEKIESLAGKARKTVFRILSSEPEREYTLQELGLTFWSVFVVAPKITSGGKPLIEVISGDVPKLVWGTNFDEETRDLLRARFASEE
ncbi:hypothetical protein V511_00595 [Mesotoga sp. Brook.08.YT.4.2.5.1]|uniref:hypothetical protein n=1 Tax=unclassified Mesotoga TaxID=1184398 RepID=UPI000C18D5ED|nr:MULTISPECIES: hypothetical protein [unclassified Mesotoga]RAM60787.1 hypothetical protein DS67_08115 [Mesotoga sp. SC_4PWA21]PNE23692.1 hypothetical protein V511_00595 [Mesotoga sp. Brook.08.YT.4.2.5.1]PNS42335.1 hypothetical protein RJ60_02130 [Mesotoga sp. B105.6.4]PVD17214.1 hypothetical protein V512_009830 [Mesotoga sp. Brook.08.105.5.1]RAO97707.1 hypothetical protein M388_08295 [Mesotoga sp. Brook.08.YT.4.2.5.4.]